MKVLKLSYNPKWTAIIIVGIFLIGMSIGNYVQRFRVSEEYRWIFEYGSLLNLLMCIGSLVWSFVHPLIVWLDRKPDWKKYLIWMIMGLLPLTYVVSMLIIANKIT